MQDKNFRVHEQCQTISVPRTLIDYLDYMTIAEVKCYMQICDSRRSILSVDNKTEEVLKSLENKGLITITNDIIEINTTIGNKKDTPKHVKTTDDVTAMLQKIEQIKGSQLSRNIINTLFSIQDRCSFSNEMLIYLAEYCIERGKLLPNYMISVADAWNEKGIKTPKDAEEKATTKYDKIVYTTLKALGRGEGQPTDTEANMIDSWSKQHNINDDTILKVCEFTALRTSPGKRLLYANKVMEKNGWDSEKILSSLKDRPKNNRSKSGTGEFLQSNFCYEDIEKELLDN